MLRWGHIPATSTCAARLDRTFWVWGWKWSLQITRDDDHVPMMFWVGQLWHTSKITWITASPRTWSAPWKPTRRPKAIIQSQGVGISMFLLIKILPSCSHQATNPAGFHAPLHLQSADCRKKFHSIQPWTCSKLDRLTSAKPWQHEPNKDVYSREIVGLSENRVQPQPQQNIILRENDGLTGCSISINFCHNFSNRQTNTHKHTNKQTKTKQTKTNRLKYELL